MRNLLFLVAVLFVIIWIMGFKGYFPIHHNLNLLLVNASLAIVFGVFEHRSEFKNKINGENQ
jgi:hypothetical protein